jgi:branched-chain amino acid transport system substrate-binding protein
MKGERRKKMKKMKKLLTTMGFLFVLIICASIGASPALSKDLTVVTLNSMSGSGAAWGINNDRGVRMMVDEINGRGGLKVGKEIYTIKVVTMDHRYQPGEAMTAAKKAVNDGVKFVIGHGGGVLTAVQSVLDPNKVIYLSCMGGGVEFTNAKYPYTFRNYPSAELRFSLFFPKLVKMIGPFKGGIIFNNDEMGRAEVRAMSQVIKERNLPIEHIDEFVERDTIDFSPVVTRLMSKGVNFILNELTPAQGPAFFKHAWELGYRGHEASITASTTLEVLLKVVGKEGLEGFISGVHWPPGRYPSAKFEKIQSKYLSLYKEEPLNIALFAYAGMEFLALALEKAGTTDTERVVKVMYDLDTETVLGPTSMVGKSLGYGIKTQMSNSMPLCEVRDGQLKLIEVLRYKD